jgi:hypothetical protein
MNLVTCCICLKIQSGELLLHIVNEGRFLKISIVHFHGKCWRGVHFVFWQQFPIKSNTFGLNFLVVRQFVIKSVHVNLVKKDSVCCALVCSH